jgi:hypothetical protein
MQSREVRALLEFLAAEQRSGRTVVTWNGAAFDIDVLAEESGDRPLAIDVATHHVDLMVVFGCVRGHPLSLGKAARASGSQKGAEGVTGDDPPLLWAKGEHGRVLAYVTQDVRATADVLNAVMRRGGFAWRTEEGSVARFIVPPHVQTLQDLIITKVLEWPPPAFSWTGPQFDRQAALAWTKA